MSTLPPAKKEVSPTPAKTAVVDPVDRAAQAADVDRKLRFYGVIQAFRQGRLPSNTQIFETLDYVVDHSPVNVDKLSPEGKKLIQDVRDIIQTSKLMVQEKNADELVQNFIWRLEGMSQAGTDGKPTGLKASEIVSEATSTAPVDSEKARADGQEATRHLRTLLTLILTNSEVRKLLSDFSLIGRDLLSIGAQKAAKTLSPDPSKLSRVDETAPADQFITEGGRVAGPNETPVLDSKIPFTDKKVRHHPKEETAFLQSETGEKRPVGEVAREGQQRYEGAKQEGYRVGEEALGRAVGTGRETAGEARGHAEEYRHSDPAGRERKVEEVRERGEQVSEEGEVKKKGFMDKMRGIRDNLTDRIPDEHRERAQDTTERGKKFFMEEYFPEERRDQFIFRFKKVILECQKHNDYQESMRWLISYVEEYAKHGRVTGQSVRESVGQRVEGEGQTSIKAATLELRTILERFANNSSMDVIFDAIDALVDDARRDEELRGWFERVDGYLRKVLLEPGYILEPDCDTQARHLRESGKQFYDGKYKGHFDNLFDSLGSWFKALAEDPLNKRFGDDWVRLTKDLLFDNDGGLKFKPELWGDIRKVILPELIQKVGYIPIPRIEYTDESLDLVVENLTLQGRNLFPNIISVEAHNFVKFSPYNAITDDYHHKLSFTLHQMQADMRDVAFYYRKKSGIPRMKDSGIADVLIGGEGVSAHVTLASTSKDKSSVFKVQDVHVKVDSLKFSIRDSKHDFLYKTLKPLASSLIKKQIQKAIRDALTTGLEYVDGQLVTVRDRMELAKVREKTGEEGERRGDVLKDIFARTKSPTRDTDTSASASIKPGGIAASVSSGSGKESQFRIVQNKRDSLLSHVGNPAGWVQRSDEKQGQVGRGEGWKSDAFTIVGKN